MKHNRTEVDNWFLQLISKMAINSEDLKFQKVDKNFNTFDFDELHLIDRLSKNLHKNQGRI